MEDSFSGRAARNYSSGPDRERLASSGLEYQSDSLVRWASSQGRLLNGENFFRKWKEQVKRDKDDAYQEPGGGGENLVYYETSRMEATPRDDTTEHNATPVKFANVYAQG